MSSYGSLIAPGSGVFPITPSDATRLVAAGLYVGVGGNVAVEAEDTSVATFVGVPTGAVVPIRVNRVLATGTTATDILGFRST